jgi:hypothetical protein
MSILPLKVICTCTNCRYDWIGYFNTGGLTKVICPNCNKEIDVWV